MRESVCVRERERERERERREERDIEGGGERERESKKNVVREKMERREDKLIPNMLILPVTHTDQRRFHRSTVK